MELWSFITNLQTKVPNNEQKIEGVESMLTALDMTESQLRGAIASLQNLLITKKTVVKLDNKITQNIAQLQL